MPYPENGYHALYKNQLDHFWFIGRHNFILEALKREIRKKITIADFGGGCGGWIFYLNKNFKNKIKSATLVDESEIALKYAKKILGTDVIIKRADLQSIRMNEKFDVITLLDVIEHCKNDIEIIKRASSFLNPGGKIIITVPALDFFWSDYDKYVGHHRRYNIKMLKNLAFKSNLTLIDSRYFMFFLSPLLYLTRGKKASNLTSSQRARNFEKYHKQPPAIINWLFSLILSFEAKLGFTFNFPFGTSLLGIFSKKEP